MRHFREDFEADLDQLSRSLAWCDLVSYALTLPLLVLLVWWWLRA